MPDIKKITREKGEEKLKTTPLDPLHKCTVLTNYQNIGIIIPSLTVRKRKNRCIPCIYWGAAIFSVVSNYSNLFLPLTFFWIVLILLLVMNW